jgi:quercetin 2,3-dioxygenase
MEISPDRVTAIGDVPIRRALPRRDRRTVGAWCFIDHLGPFEIGPTAAGETSMSIGPHPHIGLHTVTWLLAGEVVHTDSLGTEVAIRPGQLNLMTAGAGVVHAEESRGYRGLAHGAQLWVAQPEATRHGPSAFEQQVDLPEVELGFGTATVLAGSLPGGAGDATSATRTDTPLVGVDLAVQPGGGEVPLDPDFEHALVVLEGTLTVRDQEPGSSGGVPEGQVLAPGSLGYLGLGRSQVALAAREPARVLVLGGEPFPETVSMWWNFVARTHDEIDAAAEAWASGADRFGPVASSLPRIPVPPRPWAGWPPRTP